MRAYTLNATAAGMTRLRQKGGASPQTLFELTNGYVNASRVPTQRPGTSWQHAFATNTVGLVAFQGVFYAFTADITKVVSTGTWQVLMLRHPTDGAAQLSKIHYAQPFMGYMYVVAEFTDAVVKHYWLQNPVSWKANTTYQTNTLTQPTTFNGFYYKAVAGPAPPVWTPSTALNYNQTYTVQPTTYNGLYYTSYANTSSSAPIVSPPYHSPAYTAPSEPSWNTAVGGTTFDFAAGNSTIVTKEPPKPPKAPPPGTGDGGRYNNPGGSGAGSGRRNVPKAL